MKRKTKFITLASALSLTTLLVACGGGGGGGTSTAGIGGSGFVSSGTITGFGSVFVNGVKFETDPNTFFDIEGTTGSQTDLAIGMVVQVNGTINPDRLTGTATSIRYNDELQGSVANFILASDSLTATFNILGIPVTIDSRTTYFDPDNDGISITSIIDGDMVELSGSFDSNERLIATRIERKDSNEQVGIEGTITNLLGRSFTLRGISVDASNAALKDLPSGLQNGIYVEVEGRFNGIQIIATEVESEELDFNDNDGNEVEVEGFITDFNSTSDFKVDRIRVNASSAKLSPSNMQLAKNLLVEVEGYMVNGVLIAEEVKMRGGDVEVSAYISSDINLANNRFEVTPVSGQPAIIIQTGMETQFENEITGIHSFPLIDLAEGTFVEIEGYLNDDGTLFASEVKITEEDDIEIQGIIESDPSIGSIKVLGVEFIIDGNTQFEDDNGNNIPQLPDFNDLVTRDQSWIKVKDTDVHDGIADKIEIESR